MYESFFALTEKPFASSPHAKRYFPSASAEVARQTLSRCIERAEGAGVLIGSPGTGKTLLCQVLAEEFRDRFEIALLDSGRLVTRRALLQAILFELGLPYRGMEEGELRLSLIDHLSHKQAHPAGLLLMVDEAHTLPLRLLEEVRMITNLARGGEPRVRLVLAGGPMLEERFTNPKLESFNQRLSARCYLAPLDKSETARYVQAQIAAAGGNADKILTPDALEAIYRATDGIPRLINQLCDHALILASAGGQDRVTKAGIDEAWSDLQQLPSPWHTTNAVSAPVASVVEFGSLSDEVEGDDPSPVPFRAADVSNPEPASQITLIQNRLASLDDDFQPAGSIRPEVELIFHDAKDPFHEVFEEEEVVIDRLTTLDLDPMRDRPVVFSAEGRELADMLAPLTAPKPPALSITDEPAVEDEIPKRVARQQPAKRTIPAVKPAATHAESATVEIVISQPWSETIPAIVHAIPQSAAEHLRSTQQQTAPLAGSNHDGSENDDDLILVEDDAHGIPARPAPVVRRQEYRQLFAKLRRG